MTLVAFNIWKRWWKESA